MSQEFGIAGFRLARMDSTGQPVSPGTDQGMVLCDATSVEVANTFSTGTDIEKKNGMGVLCFARKLADQLKGATLSATFCQMTWLASELIQNGNAELLGGGTPTGIAISTVQCGVTTARGGVQPEWWTENNICGVIDPTNPYIQHIGGRWFANAEDGTYGSEAAKDYVFSGDLQSAVIGDGAFGDWGDLTADSSYLRASQYATEIPECSDELIDATSVS